MKERINKHRNRMKRRKNMRQKYVISRDGAKNKLKIREYAIIDKNLKKVASSMLRKGNFSFLCEETYESEIIVSSISKGMNALVAILRTHNIFPIQPYATKIAESVMSLYKGSEDGSVERKEVRFVMDLKWFRRRGLIFLHNTHKSRSLLN